MNKTFQIYRNYPTKSEFDTYIQKAKKSIMDTRNHSAIKNVASELQDVQKIMGSKNSWKIFVAYEIIFSRKSGRSFTAWYGS